MWFDNPDILAQIMNSRKTEEFCSETTAVLYDA